MKKERKKKHFFLCIIVATARIKFLFVCKLVNCSASHTHTTAPTHGNNAILICLMHIYYYSTISLLRYIFLNKSLKRYRRHCKMPFLPCDWITAHLPTSLKSPKIVFTFRNDILVIWQKAVKHTLVSRLLTFFTGVCFLLLAWE